MIIGKWSEMKWGKRRKRKREGEERYNVRVLVRVTLVHGNALASDQEESEVAVLAANGIDANVINPTKVLEYSFVFAALRAFSARRRRLHLLLLRCCAALRESQLNEITLQWNQMHPLRLIFFSQTLGSCPAFSNIRSLFAHVDLSPGSHFFSLLFLSFSSTFYFYFFFSLFLCFLFPSQPNLDPFHQPQSAKFRNYPCHPLSNYLPILWKTKQNNEKENCFSLF